jgi:hypothetical protein
MGLVLLTAPSSIFFCESIRSSEGYDRTRYMLNNSKALLACTALRF